MRKLYSPKTVREIMDLYGFKFTKSLGQNFLIDKNFVDKIIGSADPRGKNIIEIGPGLGTIGYEAAKVCKNLILVEIDRKLIPILKENFSEFDNTRIINEDFLKLDLEDLIEKDFGGEDYQVISNLPYYITTPIIEKLIESKKPPRKMTIMVQKEVADRILADVGDKDYSSLSVFIKFFAKASRVTNVPKTVFMPKPKVDSAVLDLDLRLYDDSVDKKKVFDLVRAGFNKRRKTILNSLSSVVSKDKLCLAFENLGIHSNLRAENLSLDDYINLVKVIETL
ncbi:MAG: 16S rRNA (adenine(1518)-N(6)/adenine(1519)-N(6))-dimethyltransferase RsmA [Anaerococcus sp.]|nr:16S rRNA (adenine(1518)-N(6)/adenine(1519)-N(6))-dimethyltransferase RsmA [Anaerococcus sp.]